MNSSGKSNRISTGISGLDEILNGGFPLKTLTVVGGAPGSGKTILTQQLAFKNATPERPAVFFQTLSEPTAKTLDYLQKFDFFDASKIGKSVFFIDLGDILKDQGLEKAAAIFLEKMKFYKPAFVIIDSFRVFADLSAGREELRKFSYIIALQLLVWECTSFLLGEYTEEELATNPLSSICDGIVVLDSTPISGDFQRFIRVLKLRGTDHSRNPHRLSISEKGIEVYVLERRFRDQNVLRAPRSNLIFVKTGIKTFDCGLDKGLSRGSSHLISGPPGVGKTLLSLEILYKGAKEFQEKGIYFSFDESEETICKRGQDFGWDLQALVKKGLLKIITFFRDEVIIEREILRIESEIKAFEAKRVVIDSLDTFLEPDVERYGRRERVLQLISVFRATGALAFLTINVPYGSTRISRFGADEALVDGIILLNSVKNDGRRQRTLEIYKLRNGAHQNGEYPMEITPQGIIVRFPDHIIQEGT